jgi:hypothetical protein
MVYKLDLTNPSSWILKNNFPINIGEITYSTAAINDEFAYVAGGNNGTVAHNNVFIYNVMIDSWFIASPLPGSGKYGGGLAVINDSTLLFVGGRNSSSVFSQIYKGEIDNSNPTVINWTAGLQYPSGPIYYPGSWGTKDGNAYFTGGSSSVYSDSKNSKAFSKTYRYNFANETFDTLSDKPTPVSHSQIFGFDTYPSPPPRIHEVHAPGGNSSGSATRVHELLIVIDTSMSGVEPIAGQVSVNYVLHQNYPNPFNPITNIRFEISKDDFVTLKIFNVTGKEITVLVNEELKRGVFKITFNRKKLTSGIYFYRIESGDYKETKKMVLLK